MHGMHGALSWVPLVHVVVRVESESRWPMALGLLIMPVILY